MGRAFHRSPVRPVQTGQNLEQGAFARAVTALEPQDLSLVQNQGEGTHAGAAGTKPFFHLLQPQLCSRSVLHQYDMLRTADRDSMRLL